MTSFFLYIAIIIIKEMGSLFCARCASGYSVIYEVCIYNRRLLFACTPCTGIVHIKEFEKEPFPIDYVIEARTGLFI